MREQPPARYTATEALTGRGANVSMMIDIARQMKRLGIRPDRTVHFALWNGEEQGLLGSFGYVKSHTDELDGHLMAGSVDIGCGRITGFFTGGCEELIPLVERALEPVEGLGPFQQVTSRSSEPTTTTS